MVLTCSARYTERAYFSLRRLGELLRYVKQSLLLYRIMNMVIEDTGRGI